MNTVLVIDDEILFLDVVKRVLTKAGYNVEIATCGKEGIQKYDRGEFDLVITDLRMLGIDGNEVVEHIRKSGRQLTPIIGVSGTPWVVKNKVFDTILPKPFQIKTLTTAVKRLLVKPCHL